MYVLNHKVEDYQTWHVASSNVPLQKLYNIDPVPRSQVLRGSI